MLLFWQRADAKKLRSQLHAKLKKAITPCCELLEQNLQQLHIQRQAYHGGSFVGNHIHKMLQVSRNTVYFSQQLSFHFSLGFVSWKPSSFSVYQTAIFFLLFQDASISLLTATTVKVCSEKAPSLIARATEVQMKFSSLLTSFGKCHRGYNTMKVFTEPEIDQLGKSVSSGITKMDNLCWNTANIKHSFFFALCIFSSKTIQRVKYVSRVFLHNAIILFTQSRYWHCGIHERLQKALPRCIGVPQAALFRRSRGAVYSTMESRPWNHGWTWWWKYSPPV